jgi:hypothetical protein
MRTQIIPAQITTIEDRIAGNFSLTQILILLAQVFLATIVFVILPPVMVLTWLKVSIILTFGVFSTTLAIRIKGKLVVHWIVILLKYNIRPKYYVFNKNDVIYRKQFLPSKAETNKEKVEKVTSKSKKVSATVAVPYLIQLEELINNKEYDVRFRTGKKGGLNVAFEKITK